MATALSNPVRQFTFWGIASLVLLQLCFSTRDYLASYLADKADAANLRRASRIDPGNAEYRYRLGRLFAFTENDAVAALPYYQAAVELNPHNARYWLDLAATEQVLGDTTAQRKALENAIRANPTNPDVAWEAGNFFLVQGDPDLAFRQFRIVLENQPNMARLVLQLCWHVTPDVGTLVANLVPPTTEANLSFLMLLISKQDAPSAGRVWDRLIGLRQPFETRYLLEYVKFLLAERQVDQARTAWQQGASLLKLTAYLPSDNLIVNGDFDQEVLNGGFDWTYRVQSGVTLTLDPTQFNTGYRSLRVAFEGVGINDAGIFQLVPVRANTAYDFSAYFKSDDIQGAGGPVFSVRDFYSGQSYVTSDELKGSEVWKRVEAAFTTGPETRLLIVRIERVPPGDVIRGRLWVDNFDLAVK